MCPQFVINGNFCANTHEGMLRIPCNCIRYFQGFRAYTSVFYLKEKDFIVSYNLQKIYLQLEPEYFFRTNKSYVANLLFVDRIIRFDNNYRHLKILLVDGSQILLSYDLLKIFYERLDNFRINHPDYPQIISMFF